jgi:hypothetical protein
MSGNEQPSYTEGDIVEIRFHDIQQISNWTPLDLAKKDTPPICKMVGYLLEETSDTVIVACGVSNDGEGDYWILPHGCVISIRKVEEAELNDFQENKNGKDSPHD